MADFGSLDSLTGGFTANGQVAGPFDTHLFPFVGVVFSGTFSGVTVNFEVSNDQSTWVPAFASETNNPLALTTQALTNNVAVGWQVPVAPFQWFRIRVSAYTSGTCNYVVRQGNLSWLGVQPVAPLYVSTGSDGITGAAGLYQNTSGAFLGTGVIPHGYNGSTNDRLRTPNVFKTLNAVVITSETTIWTPAGGKKFRLMGLLITQGVVTGAVTLKDNTAGTTIAIIPQNTIGVALPLMLFGNGILSAAANNVLTATGASTETITGMVFGTEE